MTISTIHTFSRNKKGMVSFGLDYEGSGKPATLSATGIASQKTEQNRGQTPNDPHPIGVSVRLIPKLRAIALEKFTRLFVAGTRVLL